MNTLQAQDLPQPSSTQRDADDRLIALSIDGSQGFPAQEENSWLLAIDGSDYSLRAASEALRLSCQSGDCSFHVVNVQHWLSKEAAESELLHRGWAATKGARALLDQAGKPWRLHVLMGDAAEHIVNLAKRLGVRGIVVGSRGLGATENLLIGSVAYKVIHLSPVSVLVAR
ncbi:universal stress protein [Propionivibrio limicola]|uniref:universal stress protein n=1 Tax=Propionivibrio limicola TaxID=167645 RepID=UPI001291F4E0|nr:universal stress protein [Propionivibrio limicola]